MIYSKYWWLISRKCNLVHWRQIKATLWHSYTHPFISCSVNSGQTVSLTTFSSCTPPLPLLPLPSPPVLHFLLYLGHFVVAIFGLLAWVWCLDFVEIGSGCEAQAGLEAIFLPRHLKYWAYKCEPPYLILPWFCMTFLSESTKDCWTACRFSGSVLCCYL